MLDAIQRWWRDGAPLRVLHRAYLSRLAAQRVHNEWVRGLLLATKNQRSPTAPPSTPSPPPRQLPRVWQMTVRGIPSKDVPVSSIQSVASPKRRSARGGKRSASPTPKAPRPSRPTPKSKTQSRRKKAGVRSGKIRSAYEQWLRTHYPKIAARYPPAPPPSPLKPQHDLDTRRLLGRAAPTSPPGYGSPHTSPSGSPRGVPHR